MDISQGVYRQGVNRLPKAFTPYIFPYIYPCLYPIPLPTPYKKMSKYGIGLFFMTCSNTELTYHENS